LFSLVPIRHFGGGTTYIYELNIESTNQISSFPNFLVNTSCSCSAKKELVSRTQKQFAHRPVTPRINAEQIEPNIYTNAAMANIKTFHLPHYTDYPIYVALFKDVTNAEFLRSQLLAANQEFDYAFLDAAMVS
jgi:hypothetical protein